MPRPLPPSKPKMTWRRAARLSFWALALAGIALGARSVNSFLQRDPHFELACSAAEAAPCADLEIHGAVYASRARIQSVFSDDFGTSVFHIPLAERRRRLLAVDWVSSASVSRVWPSRIVVTITERTPTAFAKLPVGSSRFRFSLIDKDGVLLAIPPRVRFHLPVVSGVTEEQSEADRGMRVKAAQHLLDDLGPQAKDISEINASNTMDMRLITEIGGHAAELWMGDQHYRSRYMHFIEHYDEIRKHSEQATIFDLRLDDRILAK
jgi:cell division septal protein FtsQ